MDKQKVNSIFEDNKDFMEAKAAGEDILKRLDGLSIANARCAIVFAVNDIARKEGKKSSDVLTDMASKAKIAEIMAAALSDAFSEVAEKIVKGFENEEGAEDGKDVSFT